MQGATPVTTPVTNKLSRSDKLMAAFDALVLSKVLGVKVGLAKITHGDSWSNGRLTRSPEPKILPYLTVAFPILHVDDNLQIRR